MKGNLRTLFRKFCLDGSVMGLKYLYLFPDRLSRCFWFAWIVFILYFAAMLTHALYMRFEALPTRINIENQFEPVAEMPYPAITVCSPNQLTKSAAQHFDKTLVDGNLSFDLTNSLRQLLGFYHFVDIDLDDLTQLQKIIDLNRYTVPDVMSLLPQSCDRFLRMCVFRRRRFPQCIGLFRPVLTKHGLCCSFNSQYYYSSSHNRNELDKNFKSQLVGDSTGFSNSLSVITDYEPDDAIDHSIQFAGSTRVMYTDWTEFPSDDESLLLAPGTESFHMIRVTATYCSPDVRDLHPDSRKCLFEHERSLAFFRKYRNSDCDLLCLVHAVEEHCQCLMFYLPRLHCTRCLKPCDFSRIACIAETKLKLNEYQNKLGCECPRDCDSRQYRVDTTIGNLKALDTMYAQRLRNNHLNESSSVMHFLFRTSYYVKQKQETVMSLTTLASNLGGVFGLCLGCSVMSVLEVCYYQYCAARNCARAHGRKLRPRSHYWGRGYYE